MIVTGDLTEITPQINYPCLPPRSPSTLEGFEQLTNQAPD